LLRSKFQFSIFHCQLSIAVYRAMMDVRKSKRTANKEFRNKNKTS